MTLVIPGDHPDPTLTRIGNDFYTTGSSFSVTPVIYHSTDLVHWRVISQPVNASWSIFGSNPGEGCWGGNIVFYNNKYWDFFGHWGTMYFVTATSPAGPWGSPVKMNCPPSVPGLGMDNSIFIDDDNSWYLMVKNGQENNWILQFGNDGQPKGKILDLRWINRAPAFPFGWTEGPGQSRDSPGAGRSYRQARLSVWRAHRPGGPTCRSRIAWSSGTASDRGTSVSA